jgi:hypothetical protein
MKNETTVVTLSSTVVGPSKDGSFPSVITSVPVIKDMSQSVTAAVPPMTIRHTMDQPGRRDRERSPGQHLLRGERPPVDGAHERVLGHRHATRAQHVDRGEEHRVAVGHALVGEPLQDDARAIGSDREPCAA